MRPLREVRGGLEAAIRSYDAASRPLGLSSLPRRQTLTYYPSSLPRLQTLTSSLSCLAGRR